MINDPTETDSLPASSSLSSLALESTDSLLSPLSSHLREL